MKNSYFLRTIKIKPDKIYSVLKIFKNLEKSKVLIIIFPDKGRRTAFIKRQKILFSKKCKCCNVLNEKYIIFPYNYWNDSSPEGFYLDIIHELTHCWQRETENINFMKLARKFEYWENPKEIEAYAFGIIEAKNKGISKKEFIEYIEENDFLNKKERKKLYENILNFKIKKCPK
jgi:hypothetical protein